MRLLWQPTLAQQEGCDLLLMPVQSATLEAAIAQVASLRGRSLACGVIVICDGLEMDQIGTLLTAGAFDFVSVPYAPRELHTRLQRAAGLLPRHRLDAAATVKIARAHDLVGSHPSFMKQLASLPVIAGCDASVLILGETGTGKEVFARAIHYMSPRSSRPLVAVNCGAIPTELVESELFGCMRGAFTSAHAARSGLVREAEGGTLFLDEIDSLPLGAQTKLLRFLQEKEYRPIGGAGICHADVRVIAASNHDLAGLTERGAFRRDLYFRLNVLNMPLPALRDRREDIPALAIHFTEQCCRTSRRPVLSLTSQALRKLTGYDWPGNVRELHNVIERAVLFCQGPVIGTDYLELPRNDASDTGIESFRVAKARTVDAFERSYIERLLTENAGNITRAASAAKKNRRAFFALMQKHAIVPERFRAI
ncbi:sigma-54 interaction domain-containing protein [Dyella subtropica]|uniref:sigma-54 interaction domain-containing protein n=1 Tax=Dyella subtropica TaxID=2992127 RepID=UPI002253977C|nr:sigma-54 dependent transcriptional regulator [Dyella subtropica]